MLGIELDGLLLQDVRNGSRGAVIEHSPVAQDFAPAVLGGNAALQAPHAELRLVVHLPRRFGTYPEDCFLVKKAAWADTQLEAVGALR
jgi:hypothetical protein